MDHGQLDKMAEIAASPRDYAVAFKARTGRKVIASYPMHLPAEIVHAAGALPVVLQESTEEISVGHGLIYPFYCGFSRSTIDQAARGELDFADGVVFGDTCVQILGSADVVRVTHPEKPVYFFQLLACMRDSWTAENVEETIGKLRRGVERMLDTTITDQALWDSIELFNENRRMIRRIYEIRRRNPEVIDATRLQDVVKSSMVMDKAEHNALLSGVLEQLAEKSGGPGFRTRVFVSGHMCHAPKPEILDMIEEVGAVIVDDDLYTGLRYVSTDIPENDADPIRAIAASYVTRNANIPDPTKIDPDVDWDGYLLNAVEASRAEGLIILMPKYCEPHMYYYPEIKEAFEREDIPHLLIETDHEQLPIESMRTRLETFVEMLRQRELA